MLICKWFYWGNLLQDVQSCVKYYNWCQTAMHPYNGPHPQQGSVAVNNPKDMLCLDFTKMDPT